MATTPAAPLARFRAELYQSVLGLRRDALFELLDAVLTGDDATSLVRHSLAPCFRRGWASACDALSDGSLDAAALRRLFAPDHAPGARRGPAAVGAGRRRSGHARRPRPARSGPGDAGRAAGCRSAASWGRGSTSGWWRCRSRTAVGCCRWSWGGATLAAGTATRLAIAQVRAAQAARGSGAPRPLLLLDSHYDVGELVAAELGVDILARLASNRRFYRPPGPYAGKGRRPKHGPVFRCHDPATHGEPDRTQTDADPRYGQVTIDVWERLHTQRPHRRVDGAAPHAGTLAPPRHRPQAAVAGLARPGAAGGPAAGVALVSAPLRRRACLPLPQADRWAGRRRARARPRRADRWSWLLAAALWQVWLARALVADRAAALGARRPPAARSARAGCGAAAEDFCLTLGTPAKPPRPARKVARTAASGSARAPPRAIRCCAVAHPRPPDPRVGRISPPPAAPRRAGTGARCPNSRFRAKRGISAPQRTVSLRREERNLP